MLLSERRGSARSACTPHPPFDVCDATSDAPAVFSPSSGAAARVLATPSSPTSTAIEGRDDSGEEGWQSPSVPWQWEVGGTAVRGGGGRSTQRKAPEPSRGGQGCRLSWSQAGEEAAEGARRKKIIGGRKMSAGPRGIWVETYSLAHASGRKVL